MRAEVYDMTSTAKQLLVDIILPIPLKKQFTYHVPASYQQQVAIGKRVEVVFGKSKHYAGIVYAISHQAPDYDTKPILQILDAEPIVFPEMLSFWHWMADYYMCSMGEIMAAAIPTLFRLSSESVLLATEATERQPENLTDEEYLVYEALQIRKKLRFGEVHKLLDGRKVYSVVQHLLLKQGCILEETFVHQYQEKKERIVELQAHWQSEDSLARLMNTWKGTPKQLEVLLALLHVQKTAGRVTQAELLKKAGASAAVLKALAEKQIVTIRHESVNRIRSEVPKLAVSFTLTPMQSQALQQIESVLTQKQVCLLHGVTGSGKTELYMKLIEQTLKAGKQVLYLLPEIALTSQITRKLEHCFGGYVVVYHSKFSDAERVEIWNKVRDGSPCLVVGARSALFLPLQRPGLVIVDEEHDSSYKQQDPSPRYHARDAAIYWANQCGAKVLLGSATPSMESYQHAMDQKYGLVSLPERFGGLALPNIEIVDTNTVALSGKVILSPQLKEAIRETIDRKKQVILFQNRRGYHPYMVCQTCSHIPKCRHCDVSLTLHKYSHKLHCHYCGSHYSQPTHCTACGSSHWRERNFGTERVEEELEQAFDSIRVARMDIDSIRGKRAHEQLIQRFERHEIDILVGTQMVVKGLDFERVALVGILDADGLLSFADFRVNERAFQLMEQVSGRAGRKEAVGRVIIQTARLTHPVIQWVLKHDYTAMVAHELGMRQSFGYPPYGRLVVVSLRHKKEPIVQQAASHLAAQLKKDIPTSILGPAPPPISRIRDQYIMELMIKIPSESASRARCKSAIRYHTEQLTTLPAFKSLTLQINVDPC
ncbi:MAG: primosomal protein N' [Ferruginibacter sp.]